jgi:hypothetical protein
MGMGLLRRRAAEAPEERGAPPHHGVYQVEVDSERHRFHEDVPFSFWGSAKIVLLLSILLWWLPQSAGYMVAGYVGGRRAGSPWRAVFAALIPVIVIFGVSAAYDNGYARGQIDFLAGLPAAVANGIGNAIPFLQPYMQFVVEYLTTFVLALQKLFGMGSNGYMVTIAFAYIGGIVADQTRREIDAKGSGSGSARVSIVQPIVERLHFGGHETEGVRPVPADHLVGAPHGGVHRWRDRPASLGELHKVAAQVDTRHASRMAPRKRPEEEEVDRAPLPEHEAAVRPAHTKESSAEMQRFVEKALRNYDRSRQTHRRRE